MELYAAPGSADLIVFNFGWLPGGDHSIFTKPQSSLGAILQGLGILKNEGLMCLCLYYGRDNGYEERDAILAFLEKLDPARYTVIISRFANRKGDMPIPICVFKQG